MNTLVVNCNTKSLLEAAGHYYAAHVLLTLQIPAPFATSIKTVWSLKNIINELVCCYFVFKSIISQWKRVTVEI